ncbi:MAG: hypothetical protein PUB01_06695 [Desulfovibrionaceae bacterium]|nr:hypothetical protein [Desulfovibrionaceae bacterium]
MKQEGSFQVPSFPYSLPAGIFILICLTGHGAPEEAAAWLESRGLRAGRDYLLA